MYALASGFLDKGRSWMRQTSFSLDLLLPPAYPGISGTRSNRHLQLGPCRWRKTSWKRRHLRWCLKNELGPSRHGVPQPLCSFAQSLTVYSVVYAMGPNKNKRRQGSNRLVLKLLMLIIHRYHTCSFIYFLKSTGSPKPTFTALSWSFANTGREVRI